MGGWISQPQNYPPLKLTFFAPENDLIGRWSNLLLGFSLTPRFRDIKQLWHVSILFYHPQRVKKLLVQCHCLAFKTYLDLDTPKFQAEFWMLKSCLSHLQFMIGRMCFSARKDVMKRFRRNSRIWIDENKHVEQNSAQKKKHLSTKNVSESPAMVDGQ